MLIKNKRLGLVYPATKQSHANANTRPSSISSTVPASTTLDSYPLSNITKQLKLSPLQKEIIVDMFARLNETKMWRLSTGTVVEQQMEMSELEGNFKGKKASESSSAGTNAQRVTAEEDKMETKKMGRKLHLLFLCQRLEYNYAECGRYDNETKKLYDGSFKMLKVSKYMIYNLYKSAPTSLREFTLVGFLMFGQCRVALNLLHHH
ncbi:hypothetical protein INT47_001154 [Mucor saturninus]|uniref:Uncharacterized protein n=1 Tax=Mucor saturninus TaxID=64648 RepID=A0A8H7RNU6_9FUNG|nr:hypothetical protein INT47_001154 [Mucor saturninus]